jgi:hypothetical protein
LTDLLNPLGRTDPTRQTQPQPPKKPGSNSNQSSLSFGIISDVALKSPQPASPFGVVTHFRRWRRDELTALQAKLGISWFREELDFHQCADQNQVSPLVTLAERNSLTWLPLINCVDANRGVEVDGTWRGNDDLAKLKRAFELHKDRLHVYESQNEPNNFGAIGSRRQQSTG